VVVRDKCDAPDGAQEGAQTGQHDRRRRIFHVVPERGLMRKASCECVCQCEMEWEGRMYRQRERNSQAGPDAHCDKVLQVHMDQSDYVGRIKATR